MTAAIPTTPQDSRCAADERHAEREAQRPKAASSERELLERLLGDGHSVEDAIDGTATSYGVTASDLRSRPWLEAAIAKASTPEPAPVEVEPQPEREPDPLDLIEQDARGRIARLEDDRGRLSLDALDEHAREDVRLELANVESELVAARAELERVGLARGERGRRDAEARESAERDAGAAALVEAAKLAKQLAAQARAVDAAAKKYAAEAASFAALHERHHDSLVVAREREPGRGGAPSAVLAGALDFHLRDVGAPQLFGARYGGLQVAPLAGSAQ